MGKNSIVNLFPQKILLTGWQSEFVMLVMTVLLPSVFPD